MPQALANPTSRATVLFEPVVVELDASTRPEAVFAALAGEPHAVFFDSAMRHETLGRYSYVAADPVDWLVVPADGSPALEAWRDRFDAPTQRLPDLPPWQGGAAGLIGYEIGRSLERLPRPRWDEFEMPALAVGLYDVVVAFDHEQRRCWAISQGLPETTPEARRERAQRRLDWVQERLATAGRRGYAASSLPPISPESLAPRYSTPYGTGLVSNFSRDGYLHAVERVLDHLRAGDAYQVNLSQRLLAPDPGDAVGLYLRLRERNPAPFGGYLDGGGWQVASASPERFLRVEGDEVETRPIKGTRPLTGDPAIDAAAGLALCQNEKDRAENVMIVDLLRNDLSRVCEDGSVDVPTLFGLERYRHVQHLVSVVTGKLRPGHDVFDLLKAALPGGSITGAPKVRAQELIASIEPTARGAYCGSLTWVGLPDAEGQRAMDSSVLIRTLTRSRGWVQAPVGGGVVVQSDPAAEYDETWHKAAGLVDAISG